QRRVPRAVLLLALDAVRRLAQLLDCIPQTLLDVLVGRHACRERDRAAAADQLVVDLARGLERVADVVPQVLVVQRALDVRSRAARFVQYFVCRLGHPSDVLSLGSQRLRTLPQSSQTMRSRARTTVR